MSLSFISFAHHHAVINGISIFTMISMFFFVSVAYSSTNDIIHVLHYYFKNCPSLPFKIVSPSYLYVDNLLMPFPNSLRIRPSSICCPRLMFVLIMTNTTIYHRTLFLWLHCYMELCWTAIYIISM